jgi:hypothetical protein
VRRLAVAIAIVAATAAAIRAIAVRKSEQLAGPGAYRLAGGPEREAFDALLAELARLEQVELARRLRALDEGGALWVSPFLPGQRLAIYVSTLGLIERIYVDRGALLLAELPFPDSDLPEEWRRLYALLRLGGTLCHELEHLDGVLEEELAYRREAAWYRTVAEASRELQLEAETKRGYEWAVESAILSVEKAAERAGG